MIKLNFGAGSNKLKGWQNYDIEMDITKPLPFEDNSVDYIMNEHVLEHITQQQGYSFMKECFRILKPNGVMRTATPSISRIHVLEDDQYRNFVKHHGWGDGLKGCGLKSIIFNFGHVCVYNEQMLYCMLQSVGFSPEITQIWQSKFPELRNLEMHGYVISHHFNNIETMCVDAQKPEQK